MEKGGGKGNRRYFHWGTEKARKTSWGPRRVERIVPTEKERGGGKPMSSPIVAQGRMKGKRPTALENWQRCWYAGNRTAGWTKKKKKERERKESRSYCACQREKDGKKGRGMISPSTSTELQVPFAIISFSERKRELSIHRGCSFLE